MFACVEFLGGPELAWPKQDLSSFAKTTNKLNRHKCSYVFESLMGFLSWLGRNRI